MSKFVEFKKFEVAHKVGIVAEDVIQYEEVMKETRTHMHVKCVKITTPDRIIFVDEPIERVANVLNSSAETVRNNERANAEEVYKLLKQDFAKQYMNGGFKG